MKPLDDKSSEMHDTCTKTIVAKVTDQSKYEVVLHIYLDLLPNVKLASDYAKFLEGDTYSSLKREMLHPFDVLEAELHTVGIDENTIQNCISIDHASPPPAPVIVHDDSTNNDRKL